MKIAYISRLQVIASSLFEAIRQAVYIIDLKLSVRKPKWRTKYQVRTHSVVYLRFDALKTHAHTRRNRKSDFNLSHPHRELHKYGFDIIVVHNLRCVFYMLAVKLIVGCWWRHNYTAWDQLCGSSRRSGSKKTSKCVWHVLLITPKILCDL